VVAGLSFIATAGNHCSRPPVRPWLDAFRQRSPHPYVSRPLGRERPSRSVLWAGGVFTFFFSPPARIASHRIAETRSAQLAQFLFTRFLRQRRTEKKLLIRHGMRLPAQRIPLWSGGLGPMRLDPRRTPARHRMRLTLPRARNTVAPLALQPDAAPGRHGHCRRETPHPRPRFVRLLLLETRATRARDGYEFGSSGSGSALSPFLLAGLPAVVPVPIPNPRCSAPSVAAERSPTV